MSDPLNIDWFECRQNLKCVHMDTRCDMHPNPACIYWKDESKRVAEDEEDCIEEYKKKHLVARSANFKCESLIHNRDSPPFNSTIWNQTHFDTTQNFTGSFKNATVIPRGTIVYIMATRCDGVPECRNGSDEKGCGFNKFVTVLLGKFKHCCKCLLSNGSTLKKNHLE